MTTSAVWFTAPALRVKEGSEQQYAEFEENWRSELKPEGPVESEAFQDFVRAAWRKREVIQAQNELGVSFLDDRADHRKFDRLLRYERDFECRCNRALQRLRKLQSERARQASEKVQDQPLPRKPAAILASFPDDVARTLYLMDIETRYANARVRAQKAGLYDPTAPAPAHRG